VLIEFSHDALAQEPQKENIKDAKVVLPPVHTHTSAPCASVERERESIRKKERGKEKKREEGARVYQEKRERSVYQKERRRQGEIFI